MEHISPLVVPAIGDIAKSAINVSSEAQLLRNDDLMVSVPVAPEIDILKKVKEASKEAALKPAPGPAAPHRLWQHAGQGGKLKYTNANIFRGKVRKLDTRRDYVDGVEVRDLGVDHVLCGEQGLFATRKFEQFNIVGEYCGIVVPNTQGGHYVANLEEKDFDESVGVDAEVCGNEMRFINAYQGIADSANVKMVTVYIASYPHLVVVCMRDISAGEEFLLDYGPNYTEMYLKPKAVSCTDPVDWGELAGGGSDTDDEGSH